jgi:hypothetical protein
LMNLIKKISNLLKLKKKKKTVSSENIFVGGSEWEQYNDNITF